MLKPTRFAVAAAALLTPIPAMAAETLCAGFTRVLQAAREDKFMASVAHRVGPGIDANRIGTVRIEGLRCEVSRYLGRGYYSCNWTKQPSGGQLDAAEAELSRCFGVRPNVVMTGLVTTTSFVLQDSGPASG